MTDGICNHRINTIVQCLQRIEKVVGTSLGHSMSNPSDDYLKVPTGTTNPSISPPSSSSMQLYPAYLSASSSLQCRDSLNPVISYNTISSDGLRSFVLHIVGAEEIETAVTASGVLFIDQYEDLLTYLANRQCKYLSISFIGPNMINVANDTVRYSYRDVIIDISYHNKLYHEIPATDLPSTPDLFVAFNAGLWGYDSWQDTFTSLLDKSYSRSNGSYVLVTSFSALEAEEDYEAIKSMLPVSSFDWIWEDEANPSRGLELERKTSLSAGTKYYDNHSWQCIRMKSVNNK